MSSSIAIPKGRQRRLAQQQQQRDSMAEASSSSSSSGFAGTTPPRAAGESSSSISAAVTPSSSYTGRTPGTSPRTQSSCHYRRPSLLSESISRSEHTVVNVGTGENVRLITCVRASQGFEWNQDMFLPSYANAHGSSSDLEHRSDPIEDIVLTDEEIANLLPS